MHLSTHLTFTGQCEAAFKLYERILGGKISGMLTYGDSPMAEQVSAEWRGKIVHATLVVGDTTLSGADVLPEHYEPPKGFYVLLNTKDVAETQRIFSALSENGVVRMAAQKTFWSPCFGVVVDQFGTPWELSCES